MRLNQHWCCSIREKMKHALAHVMTDGKEKEEEKEQQCKVGKKEVDEARRAARSFAGKN